MPSLEYPRGEKNISIPIKWYNYSNSNDVLNIIPYIVNGQQYTVKVLKAPSEERNWWVETNKPNNTNPNILGYANLKSKSLFPQKLELIPQETIRQFDFHNGYFVVNDREGQYEICFQREFGEEANKIQEIIRRCDFVPYDTALTNENFRRQNQEELERKRIEEEEQKKQALKELEKYVSNYQQDSNDSSTLGRISRRIFAWPELHREITVFRGQKDPMVQLIWTGPERFFSTSLDWYISEQQFTSDKDNCCLFVIHAQPGVKYYSIVGDIDEAIKNYNAVRAGNENAEYRLNEREGFEEEVLLEGNGVFYQDKAKTTPGFRELSVEELKQLKIKIVERPMTHTRFGKSVTQKTGVFEAYYFPPEKKGGKRRKSRKGKQKKRKTRKH
jgi:hypothetical protein